MSSILLLAVSFAQNPDVAKLKAIVGKSYEIKDYSVQYSTATRIHHATVQYRTVLCFGTIWKPYI